MTRWNAQAEYQKRFQKAYSELKDDKDSKAS